MTKKVKIAIDAMGGENAPRKIIEGVKISLESNKDNFFYLYGESGAMMLSLLLLYAYYL